MYDGGRSFTYRLHIRVAQAENWCSFLSIVVVGRRWPPSHVYHDDEFNTSICKPSISCKTLVNSLKQTEVLFDSLVVLANFEDVKAGIEQERHL